MRRLVGAVLVVLALSFGASGTLPIFAATDQVVDNDTPGQKLGDLRRAELNGQVPPDRVVVVYDQATDTAAPERLSVRQSAAAQVVHASRALKRDVLRVASGDASAVAQRLRRLPGVRDAYPDRIAHATLAVNDPMLS